MKKIIFLSLISVFCFACEKAEPKKENQKGEEFQNTICVDFSDVALPEAGYLDADLNGMFKSKDVTFISEWAPEYGGYSNGGIYPSKLNDSQTVGILNQYSVYPSVNGNFAVVYYSDYITQTEGNFAAFELPKETTVFNLELANSTYVYWAMKTGDDGIGACRAYKEGDWYKVIFKGFNANGDQTGMVEYYLADFRGGKAYISTTWEKVDLRGLGNKVKRVEISMDGTDRSDWGLNTPTYCCIDNIEYEK